jgi:hypothetical protein
MKHSPSLSSLPCLVLTALSLGAAGFSHAATVSAGFTGGNGTVSPDQYAGTAGAGWDAGWGTTGATAPSATVTNGSPVNGGGNYLSVSTSFNSDNAIGREFDNTGSSGGFATSTQPLTLTFDVRIDTLTGWDTANDYLTLHAANSTGGTFNVSAASSYIIRAFGASPVAGKNANEWLLYSGASDGGGYNANNFVNSGMALTSGTTYTFSITNDPVAKKYSGSIFNGTTTVTWSNLGWRATTASDRFAINSRVSAASGDVLGYSLDNLTIVPEPTASSLAILTGLALLTRRRK